jgi:DNA-binding IscR family transcriptional regulator
MRTDSKLSRMLHVLLHMAQHSEPYTSEHIARMLQTNQVVVRRTMAGLRKAGYVKSVAGQGGGWTLACDLQTTSLLDIHRAVGGIGIFAVGINNRASECAVERVVNAALDDAIKLAEEMLTDRLGNLSLAQLAEQFEAACRDCG